mmetsp:Transcript_17269/g.37281  ORF Transcript_17269/g.37281 Transcript_17269/m.37281 type:complete len:698 (+) Transcript_17269:1118-3211(+)
MSKASVASKASESGGLRVSFANLSDLQEMRDDDDHVENRTRSSEDEMNHVGTVGTSIVNMTRSAKTKISQSEKRAISLSLLLAFLVIVGVAVGLGVGLNGPGVEGSASTVSTDYELNVDPEYGMTGGEVSPNKDGPQDDDDDDDDNTAAGIVSDNENTVSYETADKLGESTNSNDTEEEQSTVNDSETNDVDTGANDGNEDNLILSGAVVPPTAYHRNQSSEGEGSADGGGEDEDAVVVGDDEKETTEETPVETAAVGAEEAGDMAPEGDVGSDDTGADNGSDPKDMTAGGDANAMAGGNVDTSAGSENNSIPTEGNVPMEGNPNEVIIPGTEQQNEQQPTQNNGMTWDEEEEEGSFLEMVQSTFNVLLLAAVLTSILVFRKRVMDRVHANPSLGVPQAMMEELADVVIKLASWVMAKIAARNGAGESGNNAGGASGAGLTGNSRGNSYGSETIPLSTATDEEWGWEDEDVGTNLELSGMGGGGDVAKEDDDLALALAMSLSESESGGDEEKGTAVPKSNFASISAKTIHKNKPPPSRPSNTNMSPFTSSKDKGKIQRASVTPTQMTAFETPSSSAASGGGDSIEDLLGQMGGAGGQMITSFGQKQPKTNAKPKSTPKKDSSDDIFASMGLSSYPSSKAMAAGGGASSTRPAPSSGGWQAPAKTSAPSLSLLADALDDDADADSWGDDGDLDDLLED